MSATELQIKQANMVHLIPAASIIVPSDRQRKEYPTKHISDLSVSIARDCLLHAIAVTDTFELIAGFCRREAVLTLTGPYKYGDTEVPQGYIPALILQSPDQQKLVRLELEENLRRKNLSALEEAQAIARLHNFIKTEHPEATGPAVKRETKAVLEANTGRSHDRDIVADSLLIDSFGDDPDVQAAGSRAEAVRIAKKKLETQFRVGIGELAKIESSDFVVQQVSARDLLTSFPPGTLSGVVVDPPYGVGADDFGGQAFVDGHNYNDSADNALAIAAEILGLAVGACKPDAHLYMFCDIRLWPKLSDIARAAGWLPYATPLIWSKPNVGHAPQVGFFTRRYETILFCRRGTRTLQSSAPDLFVFNAVREKIHAAEKPVELLTHLCKLSFLPGETIADPCCGSGSIFGAAKAAGLKCYGADIDPNAIGLAKKRIIEL